MNAITKAVLAERERCAKIADARLLEDTRRWKDETDWRQPYAFNRVAGASMGIAATIRSAPPTIATDEVR